MSKDNSDDFVAGLIGAALFGLAAYGVYKLIETATKTPEQKLLDHLGKNLSLIDKRYAMDECEIPYRGVRHDS